MEPAAIKKVQDQLSSLRPVLLTEGGHSFLSLFDEFMQEHEFELALHLVCDFILDGNSSQADKSTVDQIQHLHAAMKIDDGCVDELRRRKLA